MCQISMKISRDLSVTPIPNCFLEEYLPDSGALCLKVYLLGYMRCYSGSPEISSDELALTLNASREEVLDCWNYWHEQGLVNIRTVAGNDLSLEFLPPDEKRVSAKKPSVQILAEPASVPAPVKKTARLAVPPVYNADEIQLFRDGCATIRDLFAMVEGCFGRPLTQSELNRFLGFYEWLKLPVDVIEVLVEHCFDTGKTGMNYIETVAMDWADRGIDSAKAAKDLLDSNGGFKRIMRAFCIERPIRQKERSLFDQWLHKKGYPIEFIEEAADRTLTETGGANYKYTAAILKSWEDEGCKTMDDIAASDRVFEEKRARRTGSRSSAAPKRPFLNYVGRDIPEEQFREMERKATEQLMRELEA